MASDALAHARTANERLVERINRVRAENKSAIRQTVGAGITIGTAFAIGYFEARYPKNADIAGFPISLVAGGVALALAGFEVGGAETAAYVGDAGRGSLAAWAAGQGGKIGRDQLAAAPKT
jgi:protein-S-isoprenylcysteine O-methyltransferase Ste14